MSACTDTGCIHNKGGNSCYVDSHKQDDDSNYDDMVYYNKDAGI